MLKRDPRAKLIYEDEGFFIRRRVYFFISGEWESEWRMNEKEYASLLGLQRQRPVFLLGVEENRRRWWMFKGDFYWEDEGYSENEIRALILDRIDQRDKRVKRAVARLSQDEISSASRQPIPDDVKMFVWQRDGGRCVKCGSQVNLEFDHIIPLTKGGSNTVRNLQLLCEECNRSKGPNLF